MKNNNNSIFSITPMMIETKRSSQVRQDHPRLKFLSQPKRLIVANIDEKTVMQSMKSGRWKRKEITKEKLHKKGYEYMNKKYLSTLMDLTGGLFKFFKWFWTSSFWLELPLPLVVVMPLPSQVKDTNKTNKKHSITFSSTHIFPIQKNATLWEFSKWVLKKHWVELKGSPKTMKGLVYIFYSKHSHRHTPRGIWVSIKWP